jgi:hypothetical protein
MPAFNKQSIPRGLQPHTMAMRCQQSGKALTMTVHNVGFAHGGGQGLLRMLQRESVGTTTNFQFFVGWSAECPEGSWKEDGPHKWLVASSDIPE